MGLLRRISRVGHARRLLALLALAPLLLACELFHVAEMTQRQGQIEEATAARSRVAADNDSLRARRERLFADVAAAEQRRAVAACAAQTERARVQVARRRLELRVVRARWLLCAARAATTERERGCLLGLATSPSDEQVTCIDPASPMASLEGCGAEPSPPPSAAELAEILGIRDTGTCLVRTALSYAF